MNNTTYRPLCKAARRNLELKAREERYGKRSLKAKKFNYDLWKADQKKKEREQERQEKKKAKEEEKENEDKNKKRSI